MTVVNNCVPLETFFEEVEKTLGLKRKSNGSVRPEGLKDHINNGVKIYSKNERSRKNRKSLNNSTYGEVLLKQQATRTLCLLYR